jgi:hypothetical protein
MVVPQLLAQYKAKITNLVIQAPSCDLTNLNHPSLPHPRDEPIHKDLVRQSAKNVVHTMEQALSEHPSLRKGVILEQLPRNDFTHLSNLSKLYNITLQQLVAQSPYHRQLVVVGHPALALTTAAKTVDMFGSPSSTHSDGIHFRGAGGSRRHTDSVLTALKTAGLALPAGWRTQGRRGAATVQPSGSDSQGIQTGNMFESLNY